MPRFRADARHVFLAQRLELEAVEEARAVMAELKPDHRPLSQQWVADYDRDHPRPEGRRRWMLELPFAAYLPAGKAAAATLEVYARRISRVEAGLVEGAPR